MSSGLTTTSYAMLSLLGVQPWSTYELTRQMDRSLGRFWPRATSKLYEEPKKLVEHGLARGAHRAGRQASAYGLQHHPAGPPGSRRVDARAGRRAGARMRQLLKIAFAEHGTRDDALATLAATRAWAQERNAENRAAAQALPGRQRTVPAPRRPDPAGRPVPHRLLPDGRRMGRLGDRPRRRVAGGSGPGPGRPEGPRGDCPPSRLVVRASAGLQRQCRPRADVDLVTRLHRYRRVGRDRRGVVVDVRPVGRAEVDDRPATVRCGHERRVRV